MIRLPGGWGHPGLHSNTTSKWNEKHSKHSAKKEEIRIVTLVLFSSLKVSLTVNDGSLTYYKWIILFGDIFFPYLHFYDNFRININWIFSEDFFAAYIIQMHIMKRKITD